MTIPKLEMSHMGMTVKDLRTMEAFYRDVLGFKATDRGVARGAPMVFLSREARDHHQIVLQEQRKSDETTINQISFRVSSLDDLREIRDVLQRAQVKELKLVDHCLSWSVYCHDPEGNRLEFFVDTPYYVHQPIIEELNLDQSDAEIMETTRTRFAKDPSFCLMSDWAEQFNAGRVAQ
jgi:catechol-2,3-dioxygenase